MTCSFLDGDFFAQEFVDVGMVNFADFCHLCRVEIN
jgi:hypothetical protein